MEASVGGNDVELLWLKLDLSRLHQLSNFICLVIHSLYHMQKLRLVKQEKEQYRKQKANHVKHYVLQFDLNPYGLPSVFWDSAVQSVADGGMLMCTATNMAVLCGGMGKSTIPSNFLYSNCFMKF
ncbi:probable tRNA (guanine(26)-N(2))-dimethyltransferase 1 isoform X2 [Tanacetum coccineum]